MDTERIEGRQGITLINDLSFPRRRLPVFPSGWLSHTHSYNCQHHHARWTSVHVCCAKKKSRYGVRNTHYHNALNLCRSIFIAFKIATAHFIFDEKRFRIAGDPYDLQPFLKTPNAQKSMHHTTIHKEKSNKMQQCIKLYYSIFIWSSSCFGRHIAHHQEPKTALAASGFSYVEGYSNKTPN
jgi:hypothetical protein